ncbi:porin [Leisingera sp. ANG-Vp]|uniref:porin n=1 Tax=Leisingera sp. ANG-Vp TaxID=1577896 RepID=UPI00057E8BD1|nr:porin [Leisingera sp. ANG-Vp]KIC19875.1 porin [Leisingera sp. ANG-Vp]
MKKVLFATTALIATAGMAAAEVKISGYGRFGLDYNDANETVVGRDEVNITSRLRIQFDMSAETDGGVTVGARIRAQAESRDGVPGTTFVTPTGTTGSGARFSGAQFHVAYGGLRVNVGNIWGAIDSIPGLYLETRAAGVGIDGAGFQSLVTQTGNNSFDWDTFTSANNGRNGIEALYSAGGFSGHLSYSQSNGGTVAGSANGTERTGVHVAYTFGDWTAALGYQDSNVVGEDKILVTVQGDLGQFGVRLAYANNQDSATVAGGALDDTDKLGLYGTVELGAASKLVAYVTNEDNPDLTTGANTVGSTDGTGYGIHYSYDLGGGVSFEAGAREASNDNTTVQAGLYFSF